MDNVPLQLLLVEDSPSDALILSETLKGGLVPIDVLPVERLSEAKQQLIETPIDVILLDLTLPDSDGLETFVALHEMAPLVPVVVLTGLANEEIGIQAVRKGAQDYLIKGQIDKELLSRSVRYAVERDQLQKALITAREQEQIERELHSVTRLAHLSQTPALKTTVEVLRIKDPDAFDELKDRYQRLLNMALERQVFKVEHDLSEYLRILSEALCHLNAGPRDVIELHSCALETLKQGATPQKIRAYIAEGRVMVLELMGHLVSFYQMAGIHKGEDDD